MRKKIIGYDMDGTLVDTRKDIIMGVRHMLKEMGKAILTDKAIEYCVGEGLQQLVEMTLGETDPKIVDQAARILKKYYEAHLLDYTKLYPQAQTLLDRFSDRIQVVITNKPEPFASQILRALKVMPYLKGVFTGDRGIPRKPDPAALLYVMREQGVSAEDVLWIGDSAVDAETGKKAGVETVLVRHGFASQHNLDQLGAEHVVDDFLDFLRLADEKNW